MIMISNPKLADAQGAVANTFKSNVVVDDNNDNNYNTNTTVSTVSSIGLDLLDIVLLSVGIVFIGTFSLVVYSMITN